MNDLAKNLRCLILRNGVEIWKEHERLENLSKELVGGQRVGFIRIDDELVNAADIVGIFTPQTMDELTKRKNGYWKCESGKWHARLKKCECANDTKENMTSEDVRRLVQ